MFLVSVTPPTVLYISILLKLSKNTFLLYPEDVLILRFYHFFPRFELNLFFQLRYYQRVSAVGTLCLQAILPIYADRFNYTGAFVML